jgi:hypothetical protein
MSTENTNITNLNPNMCSFCKKEPSIHKFDICFECYVIARRQHKIITNTSNHGIRPTKRFCKFCCERPIMSHYDFCDLCMNRYIQNGNSWQGLNRKAKIDGFEDPYSDFEEEDEEDDNWD